MQGDLYEQTVTLVGLARDDGDLDQSGEAVDGRCRWMDESAEAGKADTEAITTEGNRMGPQSGKNTLDYSGSTP